MQDRMKSQVHQSSQILGHLLLKQKWRGVMVILLVGIALGAGFWLGNSRASKAYWTNKRATFAVSLLAIEKFRAGEEKAGLEAVENHCYSAAVSLLNSRQIGPDDFVMKSLLPDLIQHRKRWATNQSDWSKIEVELEKLIGEASGGE